MVRLLKGNDCAQCLNLVSTLPWAHDLTALDKAHGIEEVLEVGARHVSDDVFSVPGALLWRWGGRLAGSWICSKTTQASDGVT